MPKKLWTAAVIAEVQRLTSAGRSIRAIAKRLQVPRSTVSAILKLEALGLPDVPTPPAAPTASGAVPRLLLHPLINPLVPLPEGIDVHPTIHHLYRDALAAARASELDVLTIAFNLPLPRFRGYLNPLAAERLRGKFTLAQDDEDDVPSLATSLTLPYGLWATAYRRLEVAFRQQEEEMQAAINRLVTVLPRDVSED